MFTRVFRPCWEWLFDAAFRVIQSIAIFSFNRRHFNVVVIINCLFAFQFLFLNNQKFRRIIHHVKFVAAESQKCIICRVLFLVNKIDKVITLLLKFCSFYFFMVIENVTVKFLRFFPQKPTLLVQLFIFGIWFVKLILFCDFSCGFTLRFLNYFLEVCGWFWILKFPFTWFHSDLRVLEEAFRFAKV